jgi:hypothetical protein
VRAFQYTLYFVVRHAAWQSSTPAKKDGVCSC